jgi:hypothetical protein
MRDTIDMAREVYGANTEWTDSQLDRLEQLVALVRADERALAAQRQWVGLTDEELSEFDVDPVEAKAMIQRLKEKNT